MAESNVSDILNKNKRKEMEAYEESESLSESSESDDDNGDEDYEAAVVAWKAEQTPITDPALLRYKQEMTAYEGFYLTDDEYLWKTYLLRLVPCDLDDESSVNRMSSHAKLAIKRFNETEGESLEFKELVRANWGITNAFLFYITFGATNGKFYETKVSVVNNAIVDFFFLRVAKYHPNLGSSSQSSTSSSSESSG